MPKLRDIQEQFAKHLLGRPTSPNIAEQIKTSQLDNKQRLQVYQNNFKLSLTSNLSAIYPVIEKLVGKQFFNYACDAFISEYPSTHGNLHEYGEEFAQFIGEFEPARSLIYLSDMARFEWAYHEVFHEADAKIFDSEKLQNIREDDYAKIVFSLNPATRLIHCQYPLLDIWQANQTDNPAEINLESKQYFFLLGRRNYENIFQDLTELEYKFLEMIKAGYKLEEISDLLADKFDDECDLNQLLIQNVSVGNICDFHIN